MHKINSSFFTQYIYIVDSFSTDKTVDIASGLGAMVVQHKWPGNHSLQFQWGLDNCPIKTEWVMKMDADEYVSPELADEINSRISNIDADVSGIYMKRRVYFLGRWMKNGGYYPTWLLRIWRYSDGRIEERWMDEHVKLVSGGVVKFENDLVDDNKNNLSWWVDKHNHYATREAVDLLNLLYGLVGYDEVLPRFFGAQEQRKRWLKIRYASLPLFLRPLLYFHWRYFIRLGFLDGKQGLIWHFLQGFWYRFLIDAKIYQIHWIANKKNISIERVIKEDFGIDLDEKS